MIKNTHKAIKDYAEAYKQANAVHNQAVTYIKANYKEGSEVYKSAMKTATDTLNNAITPMKDMCVQKVRSDFEDVRKAITNAVTVAPSAELLGILPMIKEGKMNNTELQMFIDKFRGNYMDAKLLSDAMGEQFMTVESIMEDLDRLEARVNKYFNDYAGEPMERISYNSAMMLNGSPIEAVDSLTDDFLTAYAEQKEGE